MTDQHEADAGGNDEQHTGAEGGPAEGGPAKAGGEPRARRVMPAPSEQALTPPAGFEDAAREIGVEFEAGDVERLGRYLALLLDENTRVNLTAVTDPAEAWTRHLLDSLTLLQVLAELPEGAEVIDVGSGGGLPGVPLAIAAPHLRFTLLEATGKKADFLQRAVRELGLTNARVLNARAEDAAHDRGEKRPDPTTGGATTRREGGHRERYDAVVARAVGPLATLAEITVPLAKIGGIVALIKGQKADEELIEAKEALHLLKATHATTVPTPTGRILVLQKPSATPRTYPRANGEPKRAPLGVKRERAAGEHGGTGEGSGAGGGGGGAAGEARGQRAGGGAGLGSAGGLPGMGPSSAGPGGSGPMRSARPEDFKRSRGRAGDPAGRPGQGVRRGRTGGGGGGGRGR